MHMAFGPGKPGPSMVSVNAKRPSVVSTPALMTTEDWPSWTRSPSPERRTIGFIREVCRVARAQRISHDC